MKNVVQFSGGKDSTAMLLLLLERGVTVDEIIFCDTGMEFPELWQELLRLDAKAPYTFLKRYSAADLEEKFALEEARENYFSV